jgi:prepilin-type N-terminal cleavage/methylation domain-containing protein
MKKTKKGFTLIELLVVISIIGLLSTLSIVALNTARARSRDARRTSDIKQIQTALEMFYNDSGFYPATGLVSGGTIATTGITYMSAIPYAPTPADGSCTTASNTYAYLQTSSGASYVLNYCIGASSGGLVAGYAGATPAGIR